jgi:RimJ/RimL family protein N-acetyltransferase
MVTNGYCTLSEVKLMLSEAGMNTNAGDDAVIEDIIEAASRHIDNETRRRFYSTSADETRYYQTTNPVRVFTDDILTVTSIKLDGDYDRTYETTLAATDYILCPDNALLNGEPYTFIEKDPLGNHGFPSNRKGIQIIGTFGYSTTAPDDIKQACIGITVSLYQSRRGMGVEGVATVTGAGVVITPRDVPQFAAKIIAARTKNWGG